MKVGAQQAVVFHVDVWYFHTPNDHMDIRCTLFHCVCVFERANCSWRQSTNTVHSC